MRRAKSLALLERLAGIEKRDRAAELAALNARLGSVVDARTALRERRDRESRVTEAEYMPYLSNFLNDTRVLDGELELAQNNLEHHVGIARDRVVSAWREEQKFVKSIAMEKHKAQEAVERRESAAMDEMTLIRSVLRQQRA